MLKTKRGIGMKPPFYAETASMKGNISWPYWIVRNSYCNSLGCFLPKEKAKRVAAAMNKVSTLEKPCHGPIIPEGWSCRDSLAPAPARAQVSAAPAIMGRAEQCHFKVWVRGLGPQSPSPRPMADALCRIAGDLRN